MSPTASPARPAIAWRETIDPANESVVLIFAPTGSDARLAADFLREAELSSRVVTSMNELCEGIAAGCGAVLVAEEVLTSTSAGVLFELLGRQPPWSELPVTLVTTAGAVGAERMRQIANFGSPGYITVLERPFRPGTLVSAMKVALRSRRRQYEIRNLLDQLHLAREEAERASCAKDEFLAALSHELRTPLNPVLLVASEAAANPTLPPAIREDFDQIARSVQLEARLIDDLLDITRITRGKLSLDRGPVDVHTALQAALATVQADIDERRLTLRLALRAERTVILADAVRFQQVLWNVLRNAAKFTPNNGTIEVVTSNEGESITVSVRDTGIGMEADELGRVFDAFVQGKHAVDGRRHHFGGLGLGLAISRRLMDLHGASICASSPGTNKGTTFTLTFPLAAGTPQATPKAATPNTEPRTGVPGTRRILLVEDHPSTRVSVQRLLERRGYEVSAAGSLAEARELAATQDFDVLLSDLGLPDGTGYELMAELQQRSNLKGIALSGYGMEADVAQSAQAGFLTHLTKPVSAAALDAALQSALEHEPRNADGHAALEVER